MSSFRKVVRNFFKLLGSFGVIQFDYGLVGGQNKKSSLGEFQDEILG